jgi:GT2 family glycosyltransferase
MLQVQPDLLRARVSRPLVACVLVGIDGWEEFTRPAIESIYRHESGVRTVVVDAASKRPYGHEHDAPNAYYWRIDPSYSYAGAINAGMALADADWTIVLNNDILCNGPFVEAVQSLDDRVLHGMQLIEFGNLRWLGGWIYAISRECWKASGPFDPAFEACGFEDLDFCIRARSAGFEVSLTRLPFRHLWGKTRWNLDGYDQTRGRNKRLVEARHGIHIGESWMWRVTE